MYAVDDLIIMLCKLKCLDDKFELPDSIVEAILFL